MSCINTVTIGLEEFDKLKERDRMLSKLERDPNAFAVFEINQYCYYAVDYKKIVHVGEDILRNMERELKDHRKRSEETENSLKAEIKALRNENIQLRRKKWWQIW